MKHFADGDPRVTWVVKATRVIPALDVTNTTGLGPFLLKVQYRDGTTELVYLVQTYDTYVDALAAAEDWLNTQLIERGYTRRASR